MTAAPKSFIREEVLHYLKACANLLADNPESHDEFMVASECLQQKDVDTPTKNLDGPRYFALRIRETWQVAMPYEILYKHFPPSPAVYSLLPSFHDSCSLYLQLVNKYCNV